MFTQTIKLNHPINRLSFKSLPSSTGVYIFKKNSEYIYIGKSNNIKARILSHLENAKEIPKEKYIFKNSNSLKYFSVDSEFNALILEASLIQKYHPKYNVIWKDGKSYLYIKVAVQDKYPKLFPVRKEVDTNSLYFGPFSSAKDVDLLLRLLRKIYPFCTQKKISPKACFYSKIGLCNPCPNLIDKLKDPIAKKVQIKQYKKNINSIIKILRGNIFPISKNMYTQLKKLTENQEYESAIKVRSSIKNLEFLIHYRRFTQEPYQEGKYSNITQLYNIINPYLSGLKRLNRIECFDVSNLSQQFATASMVVAINGMPDKSQYRKFKIKKPESISDFEMLKEAVDRRLKQKWPFPDLIILDGGRPQVKIIKEALELIQNNIPVIGIAKNPDRLIMGNSSLTAFKPALYHDGFNLVRLLRDESHRFARKYHLYLRERKII